MNSWESKTTIIIPTYNERENIKPLVEDILSRHPGISIFVVDDNSPDGTRDVVTALKIKYPTIELLNRSAKDGLGNAYKAAYQIILQRPHIQKIITMDADGSHHPMYIKDIFEKAFTHDLVVGSRYVRHGGISNWNWRRKMLSKWGNVYVRALCLIGIKDLTAGFICISTDIAKKIDIGSIASAGYSYQIEFKYRCVKQHAKHIELPIMFSERKVGQSKMSGKIIKEGLITPIKIFGDRALMFVRSFLNY
ncbi:MAG: polyprenol monophosphomannose synthase [Patescibacteria group bacterium]